MILSIYLRYTTTQKPYTIDEKIMFKELDDLIKNMGKVYLKKT